MLSRACHFLLPLLLGLVPAAFAQETQQADQPPVVHPEFGTRWASADDEIRVTFLTRKQQFSLTETETLDSDIASPKSVNIHPSGRKYYVNSLEGSKTVVYDFATHTKTKVIQHKFTEAEKGLWAPSSGLFSFNHPYDDPDTFTGKPVESTFSHGGRYLWVPYYRRSYDINAQEPSAMAVIDTQTDEIVRMFETGPLPKMVATSPDGTRLVVTHWGNNTVALMDISSEQPVDWHYITNLVVDYELKLDFSLTEPVDRDTNSGYCLRGTVFTPDNHYLLVGCMGGGGGIAVIDLTTNTYLGRVMGAKPNLRHLIIKGDYLYASINRTGYIQRIPLADFLKKAAVLDGDKHKIVYVRNWTNCKVPAGARTIEASPDGHFIFAACNFSSCLAVVDAWEMKLLGTIPADSFPVGLDISRDGRYVFTTSQARDIAGNCVDIFEVQYARAQIIRDPLDWLPPMPGIFGSGARPLREWVLSPR